MAGYGFETEGNTIVSDFLSQVKGRTFLITGPSQGGLGAETAISLAHGSPSTLILLGRNIPKIQPTIDSIHSVSPTTTVKFVSVSLDSLASVRDAANAILSDPSIPNIDVIINNAAIMACPYALSTDGYELQFATNHLSHFLLTNILLPKLHTSIPGQQARIVNISSWGHVFSSVRFDDPNFHEGKEYLSWEGYGQSKTANILMAVALNSRFQESGNQSIKAFALHPGSIASGLQKYVEGDPAVMKAALDTLKKWGQPMPTRKTLQQGCSTTLRAALDPALNDSEKIYLHDCQVKSDPGVVMEYALDKENARKCWELSEKMVGEKFAIKN